MADETEQVLDTGNVAETTDTNTVVEPTLEELQTTMKELIKSNETQKNEIQGLNKANSTQKTQYDELLKANETEKQTAERLVLEEKKVHEDAQNDFLNNKAEFAKKENDFNVRVKALELGFTGEDIEALGFNDVDSVVKYKTFLDGKITASKEAQTQEIESALSGSRDSYNKDTKVDNMPKALLKAFD